MVVLQLPHSPCLGWCVGNYQDSSQRVNDLEQSSNHFLVRGSIRQQTSYLFKINFNTILPLSITSTAIRAFQSWPVQKVIKFQLQHIVFTLNYGKKNQLSQENRPEPNSSWIYQAVVPMPMIFCCSGFFRIPSASLLSSLKITASPCFHNHHRL